MGNLGFKIKRFFQNKNTVTIIGVVLMVGIVYFGYQWRVKKDTTPVRVPCAAVTIQPRTKITEDMIEYIEVSPTMVNSSTLKDIRNICGLSYQVIIIVQCFIIILFLIFFIQILFS